MTHPNDQDPRPDDLPPVDSVIHEARESSWHLPPSEPEPVKAAPEVAAAQAAAAARPAPAAAPAPGVSPAPAVAPAAAVAPAPAPAVAHDPAHGAPAAAHASTAAPDAHGAVPHGDAHAAAAHGSGHGDTHAEERLGPVDTAMWGAGVLATAIGLLVAVCFVLATAGTGAY